jgi:hypothetical protein
MKTETENLKNFIESFFIKLNCRLEWNNDCLLIDNIPEEFQKLYGKKSPYLLVFNKDDNDKIENSDFITKGSYLVKIVALYLETKGKTTLLKLFNNLNIKKELSNLLNLRDFDFFNYQIRYNNHYIYSFSFKTIFQYLNEKEQIVNRLYIKDGHFLQSFNINEYDPIDGKKQDISDIKDIHKEYETAKEQLKVILQEKIKEISKNLNHKLELEIRRIKSHHIHVINEFIENFDNSSTERSKFTNKTISKTSDPIKEIVYTKEYETQENFAKFSGDPFHQKLALKELESKLKKEEEFFIADEKQKHSLNIKNSLLNASIIYYPVYNLRFFLKKEKIISRQIDLNFDPLKNRFSDIFCDHCKKVINTVKLCSIGHLSCDSCLTRCPNCGEQACNSCVKLYCNSCQKQICYKCRHSCYKCSKIVCTNHIFNDFMTQKKICSKCSKLCPVCHKHTDKIYFRKCSKCSKEICPRCSRYEFFEFSKKTFCPDCLKFES